jgi:hypothetical protein
MFDNRLIYNGLFALETPNGNRHAVLRNIAMRLFSQARQAAFFEQLYCFMLSRFSGLRDLAALPSSQVRSRRYGGRKTVLLDKICGSMGRIADFDCHFHPRSDRLEDRWVSVAMARMQHIPLEPVNLIQVGECYFVQDGHHRISVARARGETTIDAEIIIWELCCPLQCVVHPEVRALPLAI